MKLTAIDYPRALGHLVVGFLVTGALGVAPVASQECSNVSYRLWTRGADEVRYRLGETVEIESGREGHIYLHVDSRSKDPYSTSAEVGYPEKYGLRGRATVVVRHVRMEAQSGEDRSAGRIRFNAVEPGTTQLGFRLVGVRSPGRLDLVANGCRTGAIPIRVLPRGGQADPPADEEEPAVSAAEELVGVLFTALLRRADVGRADQEFVRWVRRDSREGLLRVADTMVSSDEFRSNALRRTDDTHGRNNLGKLRQLLLGDMYRDLYGYSEPDRQGREDDLLDLEDCLSGRPGNEACSRLGRELVNRRLFYDYHRDAIDALSGRRGRR